MYQYIPVPRMTQEVNDDYRQYRLEIMPLELTVPRWRARQRTSNSPIKSNAIRVALSRARNYEAFSRSLCNPSKQLGIQHAWHISNRLGKDSSDKNSQKLVPEGKREKRLLVNWSTHIYIYLYIYVYVTHIEPSVFKYI